MAFEDYKQKESVVVVYTGDGKGKTTASLGLTIRALGNNWKVAYIQFVKYWGVSEHIFIRDIQSIYKDDLYFFKGGKGFFNAGDLSEQNVTEDQHREAALETYKIALEKVKSGNYDLIVCDEINNAVNDGLLKESQLKELIFSKHSKTSLCLTGRNFPEGLVKYADIVTNMTKVKHHFDDKFIANKGIDF